MTSVVNRDEPPAEKKGSVTPVVGTSPDATAMFRSACRHSAEVSPKATEAEKRSFDSSAMRYPRQASSAEEGQDEQRAEEARLLAHDRVDEVRVGHRQGTQLRRAAAQPLAEEPAAHERGLGRDDLVAGPRAVGGEVEEREEALDPVLPGEKQEKTERNREQGHEDELQQPHLRDVHHRKAGDQDEDRRGVVVLQQDDPGENAGDDERGNERVHRDASLPPRAARSTRRGRGSGSASRAPRAGRRIRRAISTAGSPAPRCPAPAGTEGGPRQGCRGGSAASSGGRPRAASGKR